jgi:hypothetical protein
LFQGYLKNKSNSTVKVPNETTSWSSFKLLEAIAAAKSFVTWRRVLPRGTSRVPTVVFIDGFWNATN